ncbi:MAG: hypothetical protein ACRDPG_08675 [Nocardioidaceae bacterium]
MPALRRTDADLGDDGPVAGYCSAACRKAAYEMRRARKPEAIRVKLVDLVITETRESVKVVDEGHGIVTRVVNVAQSPRAFANVVGHLAGMARNKEPLDDPKWQPVVRAIEDLNKAILGKPAGRRW